MAHGPGGTADGAAGGAGTGRREDVTGSASSSCASPRAELRATQWLTGYGPAPPVWPISRSVVALDEDAGDVLRCIEFPRIAGGKHFNTEREWFQQMLREIGQTGGAGPYPVNH